MKLNFSERIRANSEAAPWVINEVKAIEEEIEQLRDELAEAKAASVCPVHIEELYTKSPEPIWGCRIWFYVVDEEDANEVISWLRERMKERGE